MSQIRTDVKDIDFLTAIRDEIARGSSITPFLGSGISAASGIPTGESFDNYLAYVVSRCIDEKHPWDVRRDGWPAPPNRVQVQESHEKLLEFYEDCLKKYNCVAIKENEVAEKATDESDETNKTVEEDRTSSNDPKRSRNTKIRHVVSRIFEVKAFKGDYKLPERGNRLIIIHSDEEGQQITITFYPEEGSSKNNVDRGFRSQLRLRHRTKPDETEENATRDPEEDRKLEKYNALINNLSDGWNQPLPERKKADVLYSLKSYLKLFSENDFEEEPDRKGFLDLLSLPGYAIPVPSAHRINIQVKRPLVPTVLRADAIWRDEEYFDQLRKDMKLSELPVDPNDSRSSLSFVKERALRSLSHWTRTLEFLSCIRPHENGKNPWLSKPDISVIDSYNAHITRDRHPNLIHNMVARLARNLRSRVILTTNFDTLVEQAFRSQGEPLQVFAVSAKGGLPNHATVRAQDCLVKLHGDILETRADSSINEPPENRDKVSFFNYLRGGNPPHQEQPREFLPSHLLVLGYSGNDARCIQMIKYVLDMDRDFRLFWVCFSDGDIEKAEALFSDYLGEVTTSTGNSLPRVVITQTERTDLLLWELYQTLNLSLPGGGYSFQFSHQIPPEPGNPAEEKASDVHAAEFIRAHTGQNNCGEASKIVYVDEPTGVSKVMAMAFQALRERRHQVVWFELEDHPAPDYLVNALLTSIGLRIGVFQKEWHRFPRMETEKLLDDLRLFVERWRIEPQNWVLFLYGRNGPGGCCGWTLSYWNQDSYATMSKILNGLRELGFRIVYLPYGAKRITANKIKTGWVADKAKELAKVGQGPILDEENGIASDYRKWAKLAWGGIDPDSDELDASNPVHVEGGHNPENDAELSGFLVKYELRKPQDSSGEEYTAAKYTDTLEKVLADFGDCSDPLRSARMIWLYGLTLFRQSRHKSALFSESVFPCPARFGFGRDNDEIRNLILFGLEDKEDDKEAANKAGTSLGTYTLVKKWIEVNNAEVERKGWVNQLTEYGLLLKKPGGYRWKYRDARLGLQYLLEQQKNFVFSPDALNIKGKIDDAEKQHDGAEKQQFQSIWRLRGRLHYWIGDWYLRAFHSTRHHIPLLEAIFHSIQALIHSPFSDVAEDDESRRESSRERLALRSLCQLGKLLHVGRESLQFWLPGADLRAGYFHGLEQEGNLLGRFLEGNHFNGNSPLHLRIRHEINVVVRELEILCSAVKSEGMPHGDRTEDFPNTSRRISTDLEDNNDPAPSLRHGTEKIAEEGWYLDFKAAFEKSELELESLWKLLENDPVGNSDDGSQLYRQFSKIRFSVFDHWKKKGAEDELLLQWVWLFSELAYRCARRAVLIRYARGTGNDEETRNLERAHWQATTAICHLSIQLARMISPVCHDRDCSLRIQLLTVYGMALGYLERFKEGHRRFNEAHALLVSGQERLDGRDLAKIHIRRADMILIRGRSLFAGICKVKNEMADQPKNSDKAKEKNWETAEYRPVLACCDDAWAALERAALGMRGVNHSCFWWYRLRMLELKTFAFFAEIENVCLGGVSEEVRRSGAMPFRRRKPLDSYLLDLLRDCLALSSGEKFRSLRALDHYLGATQLLPKEPSDGKARCLAADGSDGFEICGFGEDSDGVEQINRQIAECWKDAKEFSESTGEDGLFAQYFSKLCERTTKIALPKMGGGSEVEDE